VAREIFVDTGGFYAILVKHDDLASTFKTA